MSESPINDDRPIVPPRLAVREVDWLGVAPWLLLLKTIGATRGGLLLAVLAAALIGGMPSGPVLDPFRLTSFGEASAEEGSAGWGNGWNVLAPRLTLLDWGRIALWAALGLVLTDHAARALTDSAPTSLVISSRRGLMRLPRLLAAIGLVVAAVGLFVGPLALLGLLMRFDWLAPLVGYVWPVVVVVLGLPSAVLGIGFLIGWPLLISAIVIDEADAFDAVSRMYAYVTQRILRLVGYVALAATVVLAGGMIVEAIAFAALATASLFAAPETGLESIAWWESVLLRAARGFYPAYFFTASAAIYLLLRRDVDGQPIDQMPAADPAPPGA